MFSQRFTGAGRMAHVPRAGRGVSACRIQHLDLGGEQRGHFHISIGSERWDPTDIYIAYVAKEHFDLIKTD